MLSRLKVIAGLECCIREHSENMCPKSCPYMDKFHRDNIGVCGDFDDDSVDVPLRVLQDAVEALKEASYQSDLKNCVNCDHYEVCVTVYNRKVNKANDYTACEHWRRKED